jgi:hypothetical protein
MIAALDYVQLAMPAGRSAMPADSTPVCWD